MSQGIRRLGRAPARPEGHVISPRTVSLLVACSLAFTLATLLLPFELVEVLGGPLVVAGAYYAGRRGGLLIGLWASLSILVAYFVLTDVDLGDLLVTIAGYLLLGIVLGIGIDGWRRQRDKLTDTLESMHAFQAQLSASQKRYRLLFEASNDAVYLHGMDHNGEPTRFVAVNDAACVRLGYTREEMLGLLPRKLDAAPRPGQLREVMARLLQEDRVVWESELRARDGEKIPVEISSSLTDVDGELVVLSIARDISGRKEQEQRLLELSLRDHLTGLLNRRGFLVMLPEHRKHAKRAGTPVVVLYADLDHLKVINDSEGHGRGDDAIKAVAEALQQTFREADLIARLGGDEFCVVAESDASADPRAFVVRLEGALLAAGKRIGLPVSMSYGTVVTDWHGLEDAHDLLERADALMYEDKRARRREEARRRGSSPEPPAASSTASGGVG
jgi:diguanylate cyclase (GGDEF)-like protein/PAS domain S-box-containing protein